MKEKLKNIKGLTIARCGAFAVVMFLIIILAWNCDDAYHAYVMAKNLVEGNGFVYNLGERVNASTCPLFTLLVAAVYAVVGDMYLSGILTCVICSGIAVWFVFFKFCKNIQSVLLALICLGCANGFLTYATSGLENCLLFCMMAVIYFMVMSKEEYGKKDLFFLAMFIGILMGARMDNVLLVAPIGIYVYFFAKKKEISIPKSVGLGILGVFPFWVWEIFSVVYYGFLFPNTAYIKLGTGLPLTNYLSRGISYMITALLNDPVLLVMPLLYGIFAVIKKDKKHILMAAGTWIYLAYVVYIGGDFMLGRHQTVPFFSAVCGLCVMFGQSVSERKSSESNAKEVSAGQAEDMSQQTAELAGEIQTDKQQKKMRNMLNGTIIAAAACAVFAFTFGATEGKRYLWNGDKYFMQCMDVADERAYYSPTTGLLAYLSTKDGDYEGIVTETFNTVEVEEMLSRETHGGQLYRGASGILVYYYLEGVHVYDFYGLADAFLARLQATYDDHWRIGHMQREIPAGYEETVITGVNCIEDEKLHEFYDALSIVIKGDLWSVERFKEIWRMNTGYYNDLLGY